MASPPSSAAAGAAVSAVALAGLVEGLALSLPLPAESARAAVTATRRIALVAAPRLGTPSEVAAIASTLIVTAQRLARDAPPSDASAGLYDAAATTRACVPVSASPILTRAYGTARSLCAGLEATFLGEAFLAEARTAFADRRAASAARDRITAAADGAIDRIAAALGQRAAAVLAGAAGECCAFITDVAGSLSPLVMVEVGRSLPSTALAWSLYADPARAADLVARNAVGTPLFMPARFEAVVPKT